MSYDNWLDSKPDGCECLSNLQEALLKIPAFVMEAEDNAEVSLRHKLHLYATTGDKAAFNGLSTDIANAQAERDWYRLILKNMKCCEASAYLLTTWQDEQERAAA